MNISAASSYPGYPLAFGILYIGFNAGVTPMMYYMGIHEYRMKLACAIQELKSKILVSNGER